MVLKVRLQRLPNVHGEVFRSAAKGVVPTVLCYSKRSSFTLFLTVLVFLSLGCRSPAADDVEDENGPYQIERVVENLTHPWGLDFLPNDESTGHAGFALLTERPGNLHVVDLERGELSQINSGVPEVVDAGQGGLLDVAVHPEYAPGQEWIYLTYAGADEGGNGFATHVARARLNRESEVLEDFEVLLVAEPFARATNHFGSRLVFDSQSRLYITTGDRQERYSAQDLASLWGKTLRINDDGSIPEDNPFIGDDEAHDAIYTYGHRNAQGMTVHPETGAIWQNEHGQRDGDEINIVDEPGGNYGWPIATYSREYTTGADIGDLPPEREDTVDPVYYWDGTRYDDGQEGFPPSGMAFYYGDAFPEWEGNLLMGNLAHEYLGRFEVEGRDVLAEHRMLTGAGRVRDVRVHPDTGYVYVLIDSPDAPLLRLRPQ